MQTEIVIEGMTCEHCEHAVGQALTAVGGITSVSVDAEAGIAVMEHEGPLAADAVAAAVAEAGYSVGE
ncbi:heavy-metal-associated domain-containing protein [Microbacterium proteolyticum]|uniref:heavy-metal-associated domain-containing protein n=1 Tax=Microbacterium proteolyticum TaxID=1572644 RepID=UPI0024168427|nr:heavy-metal-associated domain-containing protein [Microbacterium proteolyticum]